MARPLFRMTILARDRALYEGQASSLVIPAEGGYLGVLANHAPMAANLAAGRITFTKEYGGDETIFSKRKGFLHVAGDEVMVLLDEAESALFA
jgi:F-type H+-transporting ATPase subunit epsilon